MLNIMYCININFLIVIKLVVYPYIKSILYQQITAYAFVYVK